MTEREQDNGPEERRDEPPADAGGGAGSRALGIERWVQFAFIALFGLSFWLYGKIVEVVWDQFAEPRQIPIALTALLIAVISTFIIYKHPKANPFMHEAASELQKVTWPTRKETWSNTVVVVITSIISALILFVFDAAWSWVTDLIYKG